MATLVAIAYPDDPDRALDAARDLAQLPFAANADLDDAVAVPSSFPSASNTFPETLTEPTGTSAMFCTLPLMCRWPSAQMYLPGSIPGCSCALSISIFICWARAIIWNSTTSLVHSRSFTTTCQEFRSLCLPPTRPPADVNHNSESTDSGFVVTRFG